MENNALIKLAQDPVGLNRLACMSNQDIEFQTYKLIRVYDHYNIGASTDEQRAAVLTLTWLANRNDVVLETVMKNADNYVRVLRTIDDSDTYNPNSFDVLARVHKSQVTEFIQRHVLDDWGLVRWQALESLVTNCPAHHLIDEIKQGYHPPKDMNYAGTNGKPSNYDIKVIRAGQNAKKKY